MTKPTTHVTFEQQLKLLLAYGFTVATRDTRVNTDHPGFYMVVESLEENEHELTYEWAVVGDDLGALVYEASCMVLDMFSRADEAMDLIMAGGTGILPVDSAANQESQT